LIFIQLLGKWKGMPLFAIISLTSERSRRRSKRDREKERDLGVYSEGGCQADPTDASELSEGIQAIAAQPEAEYALRS
jgi:hypothetical protein